VPKRVQPAKSVPFESKSIPPHLLNPTPEPTAVAAPVEELMVYRVASALGPQPAKPNKVEGATPALA